MKKLMFFVAMMIYVLSSCNEAHHEEAHEGEHQHDHSEERVQYTIYSNEFELFAEANYFMIGKSANILSHFSYLSDFKALDNASITLKLIVGDKTYSETLEEPTRKGIFSFDITPETAGKAKMIYEINTEKGKFELIVPDVFVCANEDDLHELLHHAESHSSTNTTVFTKEQSWKIEFATDYPKLEPFGQVIKTSAQVQSAQGDEMIVSAKTSGMVVFSNTNVLEGKNVSNGQVLFTITGNGFSDKSINVSFAEAKNNYEKAKAEYERHKELAKEKIVSEKELMQAKTEYENAKVLYDNLSKNFNASGQVVVSPMSGFVKQLFVQNGEYVQEGQPIVSISQNKTLLLKADVQQKYSNILGNITSANIKTIQDSKIYSFEQLNGKILSYGRNANSDNYLVPVSIQIDNKGSFIPGGFVELFLKTTTNTNAITIPNTALIEEQGVFYVFVQIIPELFEKREVILGSTDGLKTEIIRGISKNERIVTKGAIMVKLAQATGTLDAHSGHVH